MFYLVFITQKAETDEIPGTPRPRCSPASPAQVVAGSQLGPDGCGFISPREETARGDGHTARALSLSLSLSTHKWNWTQLKFCR